MQNQLKPKNPNNSNNNVIHIAIQLPLMKNISLFLSDVVFFMFGQYIHFEKFAYATFAQIESHGFFFRYLEFTTHFARQANTCTLATWG